MPNAKIQKEDYLLDEVGNFEYFITDDAGTFSFLNAVDPSIGVPGSALIAKTSSAVGMNKYFLRTIGRAGVVPEFMLLRGLIAVGGTPSAITFNVNALKRISPADEQAPISWIKNAEGDVTITTSSNHGWSVGDYIDFDGDLTSDGGDVEFENVGTTLLAWKINEIISPNQFRLLNDEITVQGNSSGSVAAKIIGRYTKEKVTTFQVTEESQDILIDLDGLDYDSMIVIDYDQVAGVQFELTFDRIMSGTWLQPSKNIQPPEAYPFNDAEKLQMSDGSFRYGDKRTLRFCSVTWLSLTKLEALSIDTLIEENQSVREVLFSPFPDDDLPAWELRYTILGVIENGSITPLVENETDYWSSARFEIIGTKLSQIL